MTFESVNHCKGEITVPGDKSISHRAVMLGSLSEGTTEISNFLQGADCLSTIDCFRRMGIEIENTHDRILIHGKGLHGLNAPSAVLDTGNSGTTTRLISGILAAQPFESTLTGDASIQKRPMRRIMEPLSMMGANITSINGNDCAPLHIIGAPLHGIHYHSKIASAQVKSAILLAGLYADGPTKVTEPSVSRNHSEIMLNYFGAHINTEGSTVTIDPEPVLRGQNVIVPGDISSAAFFIAAGLIVPDAEVLIHNVGINPTRDGIIKVAQAMGGDISYLNIRYDGEPTADLLVRHSNLHGITIEGDIIPTLIDELPIINVMAACANGTTTIRNAEELRAKESNRIDVMVDYLSAMGCDIAGTPDGMIINGGKPLHGTKIYPHMDHRIAMSFAIASLVADGITEIADSDIVTVSYPNFYDDLNRLTH